MQKRLKRPRDTIELAKLIGDIAMGELLDEEINFKDEIAVREGSKGGKIRAANLTSERRREIAKKAAEKRWEKG